MNNINTGINIQQASQIINHKSTLPADNSLKEDVISISGQKDDACPKESLLRKNSMNMSGNNAGESQVVTEPNIPQIEMQDISPTLKLPIPTLSYKGSDGDDQINVSQSEDGYFIVNCNGHEKSFAKNEFVRISFDLGEGNNFFYADPTVKYDLKVKAGDGDNNITTGKGNDTVTVGAGNNNIYAGTGHDIVITGENIALGVQNNGNNIIYGGYGNDVIVTKGSGNNKIYGGPGDDYLQGGLGNDIIGGGPGDDVIYGLDGNDIISGGKGNDYIDGGNGDDIIGDSNGKNIISSGKGNDKIDKGSDKAGKGDELGVLIDDIEIKSVNSGDEIYIYDIAMKGVNSGDKVYVYDSSKTASLGQSIKIEGDAEFKARVESDLNTMRALPSGKKMLEELDKTGKTITIKALNWEEKNGYAKEADHSKSFYVFNGEKNTGSDVTISYNPSYSYTKKSMEKNPPLGVLFHEMAHAYNMATGTMLTGYWTDAVTLDEKTRALEYQAVGLEIKNLVGVPDGMDYSSFPNDATPVNLPLIHPDGTISYNNPKGLSENALRADLNIAVRTEY